MNTWVVILQILNTIAVVLIGLFLRSYLPSYFVEKGKNLATKEDVSDITDKVEKVRTAYARQIEEIRAEIALVVNKKEGYYNEQRISLLKFYDLSVEFFYEKLAINFGDFPMDEGQSLVSFQNSFYETVSRLLKSYQRIVIYFDSKEELSIEAEKVINQVLNARAVMKKHFLGIKDTTMKESRAFKSGDKEKYELAVQESNDANRLFWNAMKPVVSELQTSLQHFLGALNRFLRPDEVSRIPKDVFS